MSVSASNGSALPTKTSSEIELKALKSIPNGQPTKSVQKKVNPLNGNEIKILKTLYEAFANSVPPNFTTEADSIRSLFERHFNAEINEKKAKKVYLVALTKSENGITGKWNERSRNKAYSELQARQKELHKMQQKVRIVLARFSFSSRTNFCQLSQQQLTVGVNELPEDKKSHGLVILDWVLKNLEVDQKEHDDQIYMPEPDSDGIRYVRFHIDIHHLLATKEIRDRLNKYFLQFAKALATIDGQPNLKGLEQLHHKMADPAFLKLPLEEQMTISRQHIWSAEASWKNVECLDLSNVGLEQLPGDVLVIIACMYRLGALFLSGNKLEILPPTLCNLPKLILLRVNGNPLSSQAYRVLHRMPNTVMLTMDSTQKEAFIKSATSDKERERANKVCAPSAAITPSQKS